MENYIEIMIYPRMGKSPSPVDPEDFTAIITADKTKKWFQNGELHRDNDLPARIWLDGRQDWCQNGVFHRYNDLL